jgi:hypothetical protein
MVLNFSMRSWYAALAALGLAGVSVAATTDTKQIPDATAIGIEAAVTSVGTLSHYIAKQKAGQRASQVWQVSTAKYAGIRRWRVGRLWYAVRSRATEYVCGIRACARLDSGVLLARHARGNDIRLHAIGELVEEMTAMGHLCNCADEDINCNLQRVFMHVHSGGATMDEKDRVKMARRLGVTLMDFSPGVFSCRLLDFFATAALRAQPLLLRPPAAGERIRKGMLHEGEARAYYLCSAAIISVLWEPSTVDQILSVLETYARLCILQRTHTLIKLTQLRVLQLASSV